MLNILSWSCWPSVYHPWWNVYLDLPTIFWLSCLILSCMNCLYILEIKPSQLHDLQVFSPILWVIFCFVHDFLCCAKALSLIRSHLFIFVFISITQGDGSKKILHKFISKCLVPMFSSRSFIVSDLTFNSLIHFELTFVYGVREYSNFILLHVAVQFPRNTYWRDCLFSFYILSPFIVDLICKCMGLFLGFLSYSVDLYFWFWASTIVFWLL